ncbi:MAG: hypothetical protein RLZZ244_3058 [Verrucomicrobiota bacterium]|jgi:2-polyprenyl-3-methyl-5-hydroxy-6-metoxy-1,4-benzoquinol methylase
MHCALCGTPALPLTYSIPGYCESESFRIFYCAQCDTQFAHPNHTSNASLYDSIYRNASRIPGYDRYVKYAEIAQYARHPLNLLCALEEAYALLRKHLQGLDPHQEKRILEIGSGLGYATHALRKAGYQVTGSDISEDAVSKARARYGDFYFTANAIQPPETLLQSFDLVFLTEVIEHLGDPIGFLQQCARLLKPGGSILITTPLKLSGTPQVWHTDLPPVHYWWFSAESMHQIARRLGAQVITDPAPGSPSGLPQGAFHPAYPSPTFHADGSLRSSPKRRLRTLLERALPPASWIFFALHQFRLLRNRKQAPPSTLAAVFTF